MTADVSGKPGEHLPARWPRWLYGIGVEPDPRFTLANERTFLAGLRTALALIVAGVALGALQFDLGVLVQKTVGAVLVLAGMLCAANAWWRWMRSEMALRTLQPLPTALFSAILTVMVVGTAAAILTARAVM